MTPEQIVTVIENKGVGFALILATAYVLYAVAKGAKAIAADFYALFHKAVYNHLDHVQKSMETLVENSNEANKKLDAQNQMLGLQGAKLDQIAEQTKKPQQ